MTDGPDKWVEEVRMWLLSEGWDAVWVGNKDVYPSWQEKEIGVAVDMEVARRAGVFVGNGVSRPQRPSNEVEANRSSRRRARISSC